MCGFCLHLVRKTPTRGQVAASGDGLADGSPEVRKALGS